MTKKFTKQVLRCIPGINVDGGSVDFNLHVLTLKACPIERFELMCAAIEGDINHAEADGGPFLDAIRKVESGEVDKIEADGNAWIAHITRDKVWFEGAYNQGIGGEVSLAQYKVAVQAYVRFLSDPERRPVEVPFPEE
jgi:hypothetical protein